MSTRGVIGVERENGSIDYVYLTHDAYPSHVIPILRHHEFRDAYGAERLISEGDLDSIVLKMSGVSVTPIRDATPSDKWWKTMNFETYLYENLQEKLNQISARLVMAEYVYVFDSDEGEWCYSDSVLKYLVSEKKGE